MRWVVCFSMSHAWNKGVHQFSCSKSCRKIIVCCWSSRRHPSFHRAVFIENGDTHILCISNNSTENLSEEIKVFLKPTILNAKFVIVSNKSANLHIIFIDTKKMGNPNKP